MQRLQDESCKSAGHQTFDCCHVIVCSRQNFGINLRNCNRMVDLREFGEDWKQCQPAIQPFGGSDYPRAKSE
jgi:hypothetical protein